MTVLRYNNVHTRLAAALDDNDTTIALEAALQEGGVNVPTLSGGNIILLGIDDEVVALTAYTAGATSGTISRGYGDTLEAAHDSGTEVENVITKADVRGSLVLLVAAVDSDPLFKQQADYLCDGVDDEVTIQAALDALGANNGTVMLAVGEYQLDATLTLSNAHSLIGTGGVVNGDGAVLTRNGDFPAVTCAGSGILLQDLYVQDGTGVTSTTIGAIRCTSSGRSWMTRVVVNVGSTSVAVELDTYGWVLDGCRFSGGQALVIDGGVEATNCLFEGEDSARYSVEIVSLSDPASFTACRAKSTGVKLEASESYMVTWTGGEIDSGGGLPSMLVDLGGSYGTVVVEGVTIEAGSSTAGDGIKVTSTGSGRVIISGCRIMVAQRHGIHLDGVDDSLIEGNIIHDVSQATDDTYSGIFLAANCDRNYIHGNVLRRAAASPQAKYGIRVDNANCDDNLIVHNDLLNSVKSGGTGAAYSDAGTGTVNSLSGNRT